MLCRAGSGRDRESYPLTPEGLSCNSTSENQARLFTATGQSPERGHSNPALELVSAANRHLGETQAQNPGRPCWSGVMRIAPEFSRILTKDKLRGSSGSQGVGLGRLAHTQAFTLLRLNLPESESSGTRSRNLCL